MSLVIWRWKSSWCRPFNKVVNVWTSKLKDDGYCYSYCLEKSWMNTVLKFSGLPLVMKWNFPYQTFFAINSVVFYEGLLSTGFQLKTVLREFPEVPTQAGKNEWDLLSLELVLCKFHRAAFMYTVKIKAVRVDYELSEIFRVNGLPNRIKIRDLESYISQKKQCQIYSNEWKCFNSPHFHQHKYLPILPSVMKPRTREQIRWTNLPQTHIQC